MLKVERLTFNLELTNMENLARWLVIGGIVLILIGGGVYLASRMGIPFGRLPGDIRIEKENFRFYFPIVTMIFLSLFVSLIIWLIRRIF